MLSKAQQSIVKLTDTYCSLKCFYDKEQKIVFELDYQDNALILSYSGKWYESVTLVT